MFLIDGKPLDLTKPNPGITIKPGGYISQSENGVTTTVTHHQPWCDSMNKMLLSHPPKPAPCNCKGA